MALSDLAFHILLALGEGPSHGYAIGKDIEERSSGRLDPTTGALYQALRRLTEEGLVGPVPAPGDADPRRKYFVLTKQGRQAAAAEARRLDALVRAARSTSNVARSTVNGTSPETRRTQQLCPVNTTVMRRAT